MMDPDYGSSGSVGGIGAVFMIGVVSLLLGVVLMTVWNLFEKRFFEGETLPIERAHMVADRVNELPTKLK